MQETLRQFTNRRVREVAVKCSVTQVEVHSCYAPEFWAQEWWEAIQAAASTGEVVASRLLDALNSIQRYHLMHSYPRCIPGGYLPPDVRERNRSSPRLFA